MFLQFDPRWTLLSLFEDFMLFNCANWPDYVVGYRRSVDILADIMLTFSHIC